MKAEAKENQRSGAAILVRLITIMAMLIEAGCRTMLLAPWPPSSKEPLMNWKLLDEKIKSKVKAYKYEAPPWASEASSDIIANCDIFGGGDSQEDAMKNFIQGRHRPWNIQSPAHPAHLMWGRMLCIVLAGWSQRGTSSSRCTVAAI